MLFIYARDKRGSEDYVREDLKIAEALLTP